MLSEQRFAFIPHGIQVPHPAVFPKEIPNFFIHLLSDKGDVVLTPFAGSGATLQETGGLGRKPIGIEIMQEYIDKMKPIPQSLI